MTGVVTITHAFVSQEEDSPDAAAAGQLVPSNWNADHVVEGAAPIDSPVLITPRAVSTPPVGDRSTLLATTASLGELTQPAQLTILGAGNVTVPADIGFVIAKNAVPASYTILLPLSTDLQYEEITVKDRMLANGSGASTFNITIATQGGEEIDGNPSVKLDVDNMALSFKKIRDDAGNITGEGYLQV
jgi:hypothetical protein